MFKNPQFRNDMAKVMFEEDGLEGTYFWFREIAFADSWNESQGYVTSGRIAVKHDEELTPPDAETIKAIAKYRRALQSVGLDLGIIEAGSIGNMVAQNDGTN